VPHVTVSSWRASTNAIVFHTAVLPPDEVAVLDGIPTTTVPRTILDLASVLDRHGLEQVIREAEVRGLSDPLSLPDLLARHPGRRGSANLRAVLADLAVGTGIAREELEARFARFIGTEHLPRPECNAALAIGGRIVFADCLWRRERLIAELDGHAVHSRPVQIDADKERDRELMLAGWRVIRITWRHLHERPEKLAADLRRLLAAG
jgi:very-short-patch-repair endonuclease